MFWRQKNYTILHLELTFQISCFRSYGTRPVTDYLVWLVLMIAIAQGVATLFLKRAEKVPPKT